MSGDSEISMVYFARLGLDTSDFLGGIKQAQGGFLAFYRDVTVSLNMTMQIFDQFMQYGQKFADLAIQAGKFGKAIKDNARDLGLSVEEYQRWVHAATAAGSSADEMTSSIRQMSVRMKDAADPTSEMGKTLATLGVNVLDSSGKMRSMNDILLDLLPAINSLPEGFDRNQVSMAIFGRSFSNIADLTSLTRDQLQKLMDQAPIMSSEKINNLDDFNTKMAVLNEKAGLLRVEVGEHLTPVMENFLMMFDNSSEGSRGFMNVLDFGVARLNEMLFLIQASAQWVALSANGEYSFQEKQQKFDEWVEKYKKDWTEINTLTSTNKTVNPRYTPPPGTPAATAPATSSVSVSSGSSGASWSDSAVVGAAGSEMYLFMMREMAAGTSYQDALNNWGQGAPTNTTKNPDSLGAIGKKTSLASIATADTKTINKEIVKQTEAYSSLNDEISKGWIDLEAKGLTHYAALSEMSRVRSQAELDYMAACVNFGGTNPIIQNKIIMSSNGPDWTPAAFTPIKADLLKAADFSTIKLSGSSQTKTEVNNNITINQVNNGVKSDAEGMNKALGKLAALRGGLP